MAAIEKPRKKRSVKTREFVVRLESPGLYDKLYAESVKRTKTERRRVPMTEIVRDALHEHLQKPSD